MPNKTAEQLRDEGLELVETNANSEWATLVIEIIEELARSHFKLTSDNVWEELERFPHIQTHQPSAMGAMFKKAQKLGYISSTETFFISKRPSSHARPIRVWESNL